MQAEGTETSGDSLPDVLQALAHERRARGVSRTAVAARMATSERAVARLETGTIDPHLSTVARFAEAIGKRVEWRLVDQEDCVAEADG
jgi:predicted transcriptional regulator